VEHQPVYTVLLGSKALWLSRRRWEKENVAVFGLDYSTRFGTDLIRSAVDGFLEGVKGERFAIGVVHNMLLPKGPYFDEPVVEYGDVCGLPVGCWAVGHDHVGYGVVRKRCDGGRSVLFVSVGALSRGSVARDDLKRVPKVALIEVDGGELGGRIVEVPCRPAAEVFDVEGHKAMKQSEERMIEFVEMLRRESSVSDDGWDWRGQLTELARGKFGEGVDVKRLVELARAYLEACL
jgi:hypothetical protein